jgi:hypothetical protein
MDSAGASFVRGKIEPAQVFSEELGHQGAPQRLALIVAITLVKEIGKQG